MSRLTQPEPSTAYRDVCLAAWVAANTDRDLGFVDLSRPIILWCGAGDEEVPAGRHTLATLGALVARPSPIGLGVDVWCRTTGVVTAGTWPALSASELLEREAELERSLKSFLRTIAVLSERCPELVAWIRSATRVVRPLVPIANVARSSHYVDVPGLVEADISRGVAQTIELVVHETAHLHLRAAQAAADLIDPCHAATYPSPLRPEPRPLIGILLAYHALAYICTALAGTAKAGVIDPENSEPVILDMSRRRNDARAVIEAARCHFTDEGAEFVDRTHDVADYAVA
jgi:HEXXH motif-containing protein